MTRALAPFVLSSCLFLCSVVDAQNTKAPTTPATQVPSAPKPKTASPAAQPPGKQPPATKSPAPSSKEQAASGDQATRSAKYRLAMAKAHTLHANDHIRLLNKYAALHEEIPAEVVQEHTDTAKYHIQAAKNSYAKLREHAKGQPDMTKQLDAMDARMAKLSAMVDKLQAENTQAERVLAHTAAISAQLKQAHDANEDVEDNFYNMDSSSYYTEGLGHFVD